MIFLGGPLKPNASVNTLRKYGSVAQCVFIYLPWKRENCEFIFRLESEMITLVELSVSAAIPSHLLLSPLRFLRFCDSRILTGWSPWRGGSHQILPLPWLTNHTGLLRSSGLDRVQGVDKSPQKLGEFFCVFCFFCFFLVLQCIKTAKKCLTLLTAPNACLQIDLFSSTLRINTTDSSPLMVNVFRRVQPGLPVSTQEADSGAGSLVSSLGLLALSLLVTWS